MISMTEKLATLAAIGVVPALNELAQAEYVIVAEFDETCVDCQSGDPEYKELDDALEAELNKRLSHGDVWAWACVHVEARITLGGVEYRGKSGWLGRCSYENEQDYVTNSGGYYEDQCAEALHALRVDIAQSRIAEILDKVG